MLEDGETFDADSQRFSISPVAYGLKMAEQAEVPWLILSRGGQLRLYPARIDLGVGRKGLAETFLEVDLPQLTRETAGYLSLIFSASALKHGGSAFEIMHASAIYAVALGERLRDKVYEEIVPRLSVAVAKQLAQNGYEMDASGLDLAYQLTLRIFFRMLFQTYSEDRRLLPYGENAKYDRNALKTVALDLVDNPNQPFDPQSTSLWDDLAQVWHVIDKGDKAWGVPAYNGGLFGADPELNSHGAIIESLAITNDVIGPCLKALLVDESKDGEFGPIDFRSLSVRGSAPSTRVCSNPASGSPRSTSPLTLTVLGSPQKRTTQSKLQQVRSISTIQVGNARAPARITRRPSWWSTSSSGRSIQRSMVTCQRLPSSSRPAIKPEPPNSSSISEWLTWRWDPATFSPQPSTTSSKKWPPSLRKMATRSQVSRKRSFN